MTDVALVSLMHDPEGRLFRAMGKHLPQLESLFAAHFLIASAGTRPEALGELSRLGVSWQRESGPGVGAARRQGVALARAAGYERILYCDSDRALHWIAHYPQELAALPDRVGNVDYLVIGRTPRAFASHPAVMRETEALANRVFGLRFGRDWDLCAAACGLSGRAADLIAQESRVVGFGTEGEWPALAIETGLTVAYTVADGLEYETADRFPEEVARAGGPAAWTAAQSASPDQWEMRLRLAADIARGCLR